MTKIAVVSDDEQTICPHFGRAPLYIVFTVDGNVIKTKETRPKTGHHNFGGNPKKDCGHGEGHGFDAGAGKRHSSMIETISDCQALIAGGMGQGAYSALRSHNITPIVSEIVNIEEAVKLYLEGNLTNQTDLLH